jgi:hypothetical protein
VGGDGERDGEGRHSGEPVRETAREDTVGGDGERDGEGRHSGEPVRETAREDTVRETA